MEAQDQRVDKPSLSLFNVIPAFASLPQSNGWQGVQVRSDVLSITPELATVLLSTQWPNRNLSPAKVKEWKRRMLAGEWMPGQPIIFDKEGYLIDGQHRLMALASLHGFNVKIPVTIIQGIPKESQSIFDIGSNRQMADILTLKGLAITKNGVATAKAMFLPFLSGGYSLSKLTSPTYMEKVVSLHAEGITEAIKLYGNNSCAFAPVRAMVALAWKHENHDTLRRFLEVWDTRRSRTEAEDPISILRDAYDSRPKFSDGAALRRDFAMKACRAIKAQIHGEKLKRVIAMSQCPWPHPMLDDSTN